MTENSARLSYLPNDPLFSSKATHGGLHPNENTNKAVVPPISLSTIFLKNLPPHDTKWDYIRNGSPSVDNFEQCLASLEGTKHGLTFSSGHAAAFTIMSLLKPGDHLIAQKDLYYGIFTLFQDLIERNIIVDFVDATDLNNVAKTLCPSTRLVWLETPSNPLMKLTDLKEISSIVKSKYPNAITVCDNTFMTPYFQRPSELGIDIVMHSCTKYIGGHSDVLMGALCTDRTDLYDSLKRLQISQGGVASPFDCYMASRSLKTLELRMRRHMKNALKVAEFLESHEAVEKVLHPGLSSHPQHKLSLRQCFGHSGMLSFYIKGNQLESSTNFIRNLKFIYYTGSLGSTETTITIPKFQVHGKSEDELTSLGLTDGLLRISVGIESVQDIIDDLRRGLDAVLDQNL